MTSEDPGTPGARGLPPDPLHTRLVIVTLSATLAATFVFVGTPAVDLWASALFYDPQDGFWLTRDPVIHAIRTVYLRTIELTVLAAAVLWAFSAMLRGHTRIPSAIWRFVTLAILLGPGILVNVVLKDHWGRARPANISAFGGEAHYTPPFQIADQCAGNCSFVSGEGSGIAMTVMIVAALAWPWIRKRPVRRLSPLVVIALFGMGLRVALGRHFLSDTVFAGLFMALIALALYRLGNIGTHRQALSPGALSADLATFGRFLTGQGSGPTLPGALRRLLHLKPRPPAE